MKRYLVIDPPEGWLYGFPKRFREMEEGETLSTRKDTLEETHKFLVENGYPKEKLESWVGFIRFWIDEVE